MLFPLVVYFHFISCDGVMSITLFLCVAVINLSTAFSDSDDVYKSKTSDDYVNCENGWYSFRDKCYRVAGRSVPERFTWTAALELCRRYGADLVSLQSQEEQDFITAYLQLDIKWWSWIGLNDRGKQGDYRWSDRSAFNYTNWNPGEPSILGIGGEEERCVHVSFDVNIDKIGKWNDRACDATEFALCEKDANPRKRSPNLKYCSPEDGGGWRYGSSCYHIVTESMSWQSAERYCKNHLKGHLLTVRDTLEDIFLELALPHTESEVWIGIKIQDQLQQKWSSGWYVSFNRLRKEERFVEGTCVAKKNREWRMIPCSVRLPFICEVSKASAPVLKPPPAGSHCPKQLDDWRDFGGDHCYYIETKQRANFHEASFDCQRRGGDLVSFHSKEEVDTLLPFVQYLHWSPVSFYLGHVPSFYIGLVRLKENNEETFGWTDGSTLDYENWAHKEPNRLFEKCVEALNHNMEWRDNLCDRNLFGYICAVKKVVSSSSLQEESDCETFCIAPETYLYGIITQNLNEAKRVSCKKG